MVHNVNKAGQTHDQLQAACWQWACKAYHPFVYGRLISIPNDMHAGNTVRWKQYEAIGVTPGVWDMQFNWVTVLQDPKAMQSLPYRLFPAVYWWEFKVGSDKLSDKQKKFHANMEPFGHTFFIAHEEHEFQQQFKNIIEPTLEQVKKVMNKDYGRTNTV